MNAYRYTKDEQMPPRLPIPTINAIRMPFLVSPPVLFDAHDRRTGTVLYVPVQVKKVPKYPYLACLVPLRIAKPVMARAWEQIMEGPRTPFLSET